MSRAAGPGHSRDEGRFLERDVDPQTRRKTHGGSEGSLSSNAPEREKKRRVCGVHFAHPECESERGVTRGRRLSILPVQRRSPANDIDFIQLCGKYICRIAKGTRNYAASC